MVATVWRGWMTPMPDLVIHTMRIPNWVWEWAQEQSGMTVPASFLLDILTEAIHVKAGNHRPTILQMLPASSDRGRVITATRTTLCDECGTRIAAGRECVIRTNSDGRKEMIHLAHIPNEPPQEQP